MDRIDRKLIELLQENARYSLKQLSELVYLSSPAVAARIDKLERENLITGYHADASLEKMGYHITTFISVAMEPKNKSSFIEFIRTVPNVLECDFVSGDFSMLVKAAFPTTTDLDVFIGKLQLYGSTQTHIVFSSPVPHRSIRFPETELKKK